ncbi:MAG: prepilin-type N-terminal cleavage/methylation domain-containing protein [Planctomycetota bacterium]
MKRSRQSGFTLIEMLISVVVLSLVLYSMGIVMKQSEDAYQAAQEQISLETRARQTMSRIVEELAGTGASVL